MPRTPRRICAVCKKQCDAWQRNADGTYLHDDCAKRMTIQMGWDRPASGVPSAGAKKEGQ